MSYKKTKNLAPRIKQDTTFSGSVRARFGDGQKSISISVGKTTTNSKGIAYTKKGTEHSISLDAKHKNGNKVLKFLIPIQKQMEKVLK